MSGRHRKASYIVRQVAKIAVTGAVIGGGSLPSRLRLKPQPTANGSRWPPVNPAETGPSTPATATRAGCSSPHVGRARRQPVRFGGQPRQQGRADRDRRAGARQPGRGAWPVCGRGLSSATPRNVVNETLPRTGSPAVATDAPPKRPCGSSFRLTPIESRRARRRRSCRLDGPAIQAASLDAPGPFLPRTGGPGAGGRPARKPRPGVDALQDVPAVATDDAAAAPMDALAAPATDTVTATDAAPAGDEPAIVDIAFDAPAPGKLRPLEALLPTRPRHPQSTPPKHRLSTRPRLRPSRLPRRLLSTLRHQARLSRPRRPKLRLPMPRPLSPPSSRPTGLTSPSR